MKKEMVNGVYIVYANGDYELFNENLPKEEGMRVGIFWDGHTWMIGTDYGNQPWSKAGYEELEANDYGIMREYEAVLDWDYMKARENLINLWSHIPFKDDETMPTAPMVMVQEHLAVKENLNNALRFCGLPEYKTGTSRWFAQRCYVSTARFFGGTYGPLSGNYVNNRYRAQAVALWNI